MFSCPDYRSVFTKLENSNIMAADTGPCAKEFGGLLSVAGVRGLIHLENEHEIDSKDDLHDGLHVVARRRRHVARPQSHDGVIRDGVRPVASRGQ